MQKKILIAVCGSIGAIKAVEVVREFIRNGIEVECIISESAKKIIHPNALEWASKNPVITEITGRVEHIHLCVNGKSLLLICPATANTISKISNGISDTVVTAFATTAIGSGIPVVIAPAMHLSLFKNPFVLENIERLKREGVRFIGPRFEGDKAKLAKTDEIVKFVLEILK